MRMTEWEWKAKVSIFSAAMLVGQLCHFGQFCQLWRVEACVAGVIASHVKSLRGCFRPIWLLAILTLGGATLWTTPSLAHFEHRALHFHLAKLLHTLEHSGWFEEFAPKPYVKNFRYFFLHYLLWSINTSLCLIVVSQLSLSVFQTFYLLLSF